MKKLDISVTKWICLWLQSNNQINFWRNLYAFDHYTTRTDRVRVWRRCRRHRRRPESDSWPGSLDGNCRSSRPCRRRGRSLPHAPFSRSLWPNVMIMMMLMMMMMSFRSVWPFSRSAVRRPPRCCCSSPRSLASSASSCSGSRPPAMRAAPALTHSRKLPLPAPPRSVGRPTLSCSAMMFLCCRLRPWSRLWPRPRPQPRPGPAPCSPADRRRRHRSSTPDSPRPGIPCDVTQQLP